MNYLQFPPPQLSVYHANVKVGQFTFTVTMLNLTSYLLDKNDPTNSFDQTNFSRIPAHRNGTSIARNAINPNPFSFFSMGVSYPRL